MHAFYSTSSLTESPRVKTVSSPGAGFTTSDRRASAQSLGGLSIALLVGAAGIVVSVDICSMVERARVRRAAERNRVSRGNKSTQ